MTMRELLVERVYQALERGHIKTALFLVEQSNMMKNSPCSFTDLQLTTLTSTADREYPVNMPVKGTEIRKKELTNMRITAMHTAAANPNSGFLQRLIQMLPDAINNSGQILDIKLSSCTLIRVIFTENYQISHCVSDENVRNKNIVVLILIRFN